MNILLDKIKPDYSKLKQFINRIAAKELSELSTPCYYPKTKRVYYELLDILHVKDKDFKEFVKRNYQGTKAEKWLLWKDPTTNLLLVVMYLFLKKRDQKSFMSTLVYYMVLQYSRLMHKQIKYCDEDTFKFTLNNLTRTHLFFREKTIPNSLFYLAKELQKKFQNAVGEWDVENIIKFIGVARHRISQSVKSFAEHYYRYKKENIGIRTQQDEPDEEGNIYQYQVLQRGQKIVEDISKKITIYKVIDHKALEEAKNITKIKTSIATLITDKLTNDKNLNNIKIALQLFIKDLQSIDMICGKEYVIYVKKLMSVKRTTAQLYFKAQINILLMNVLKEMDYVEIYNKYTSQTQFIINSFLAFYLTGMIKNSLCKSL